MQVDRAELLKALKIVKPGLATRELIEQSGSFVFSNGRVITYNDAISVSHPIPALAPLTGAVSSNELYDLLDKISHETIEIDDNQNEMHLQAGRIKAGLTMHSEILLPLAEIQSDKEWTAVPEQLKEALKFTVYSCSRDVSSPALTCVHINATMVESSDGVRLTQFNLDQEVKSDLLVPGKSAKELIDYPIKSMAVDKSWVHFLTDEDTILSCRILAGKYPDTSKITEVEGHEIKFPSRLSESLSRADIFAERDHELDEEVEIELSDRQIKVRSKSESGWFEETTPARYRGDTIQFIVHPTFLKEICQRHNTCIVSTDRLKFYSDNWLHVIALKTT